MLQGRGPTQILSAFLDPKRSLKLNFFFSQCVDFFPNFKVSVNEAWHCCVKYFSYDVLSGDGMLH